jgi:uncharacterized protein (TIGR04255 family)
MSKERDFLYDNPPLAEVIAEIHWELVPLKSVPGGGVDPSFEPFSGAINGIFADNGYTHIERMIPDQVPLEFLAHKVVSRFRTSANKWPLFQIGPGLLTVNIVPPYQGWSSFAPALKLGFEALHKAYPSASTHLRIKRMEVFTCGKGPIRLVRSKHRRSPAGLVLLRGCNCIRPDAASAGMEWTGRTTG